VLQLLAAGLTDSAIADQLSLSPRTVQSHVRAIYSKLNVGTRSAATRYAMEHGLV
jgi:DNA-binding NarL/FixJ family response regulator